MQSRHSQRWRRAKWWPTRSIVALRGLPGRDGVRQTKWPEIAGGGVEGAQSKMLRLRYRCSRRTRVLCCYLARPSRRGYSTCQQIACCRPWSERRAGVGPRPCAQAKVGPSEATLVQRDHVEESAREVAQRQQTVARGAHRAP